MTKKKILFLTLVLPVLCSFLSTVQLYPRDWRQMLNKKTATFDEIRRAFYKEWRKNGAKKNGMWKQFKRWEWFAETRLDAKGQLNPGLIWKGWLEKQQRFEARDAGLGDYWTELGPVQLPDGSYTSEGSPGMGRLNCITFHPDNPDHIWVGAATGGLWKTTDAGATWSTQTDYLPNLGVSSFIIHPANPAVMYMATGDCDGWDIYSIGVLKSTDGGNTWNPTGLNPDVSSKWRLNKLMMHPSDPDTILAAVTEGLYKSTDGGATWNLKEPGYFRDIEVDPSSPSTWYATVEKTGIYKSTDSGETWTELTTGLPAAGFYRIAITICRAQPHILYAIYASDTRYGLLGLYRSDDGGASWTLRADSPNLLGRSVDGRDSTGQGYYDLTLDVHPTNPDIVYVGGINMWKSVDGGRSWKLSSFWINGWPGTAYAHADHHAFAFHPQNPDIVFSGNDGGLFKSNDAGESWTDLSSGLAIHQVYRMGVSAQDAGMLVTGSQDVGSDIRLEGSWKAVFGGDGMECLIDPLNNAIVYVSSQVGHFYRSDDFGKNYVPIFQGIQDKATWTTPLVMDPNNPAVLYAAYTRVFKSSDRGNTYTAISHHLGGEDSGILRFMAISPTDTNYIYTTDYENIYITTNGGTSWKTAAGPETTGRISSLTVHPHNPTTLWLTLGGFVAGEKVYLSTDAGDTWTNVSGTLPNIPANCMAADPATNAVYLGTDLGVFYSSTGGAPWHAFDNRLPNVIISDLEIHAGAKRILAATYGRGIWESPLASVPEISPPAEFNGSRFENRSLLSLEHLDVLTWQANPANQGKQLVNYKIYRLEGGTEILLTTVSAGTFQYFARKVENIPQIYCISSVNDQGIESLKTCIAVNPDQ
jgi:photosystem II stability/assembly factor-like uncharacterized protein